MTGIRVVPSEGDQIKYLQKAVDPTVSDFSYPILTMWINTSSNALFIHLGSGVWTKMSTAASPNGWGTPSPVTISGGSITVTGPGIYAVTGEGGLADNLESISGGSIGDEIILYAANTATTITVKNNTVIKVGYDFNLDDSYDKCRLIKYSATIWTGGGISDNA